MKQLALLLVDVRQISREKCPYILRLLKNQRYFWLPKYPLDVFGCVWLTPQNSKTGALALSSPYIRTALKHVGWRRISAAGSLKFFSLA